MWFHRFPLVVPTIQTFEELTAFLRPRSSLDGLKKAIETFEEIVHKHHHPTFNFYQHLMPFIQRKTNQLTVLPQLIKLKQNQPQSIALPHSTILSLLCHAFFINLSGDLSFTYLYQLTAPVSTARLHALFYYFYYHSQQPTPLSYVVEYERCVGSSLPTNDQILSPSLVTFHDSRMEQVQGSTALVDFANKQIHIGRIISSATQEEILFSNSPELFLLLLLAEPLQDQEVIVVRNVLRYNDYTGYNNTYQFQWVMDAVERDHFHPRSITRDIKKAYVAFAHTRKSRIVTGKWGCGVFGGDVMLKFWQQVLAAHYAGKQLDFCVWNEPHELERLKNMFYYIMEKKWTGTQLWTVLTQGPLYRHVFQ